MLKANVSQFQGKLLVAAEYPSSAHSEIVEYTDFDFCIALIAKRDKRYREIFADKNRFRVVDSGIFEDPANPITPEELIETAINLEADEVVAVDLINDCAGTLTEMEKFLSLRANFPFPFQIQGVIQGASLLEWLYCYDQFINNPRVDVIGLAYFEVPKDLRSLSTTDFGVSDLAESARMTLLHLIVGGMSARKIGEQYEIYYRGPINKPIHILGLRDPKALSYYRALPCVRSLDTSFATQLGVEGRILEEKSVKPSFKVNFNADPNRTEKILMALNQYRLQTYCKGGFDLSSWAAIDTTIKAKSC